MLISAFGKVLSCPKLKALIVMKLTVVLLLCFLQVSAWTYSQKVTLRFDKEPLTKVLSEIERQSGYSFIYGKKLLATANPVSVELTDASIETALKTIFNKQPLHYKINNHYVIISAKTEHVPNLVTTSVPVQEVVSPPPTVRGRILNEAGEPVAGVTIMVKGGKVVGLTDQKGEFELKNIANDAILVFSSVNMEQLEVRLNGRTELNFSMKAASSKLDEIVMIGYGSTSKRETTASISSITAEEIMKQPVQNPLNALQGRVAGALVTQSNGLPGSRVTIQIRGVNVIDNTSAGSQPLYLVDGVPFGITDGAIPVNNDLTGRSPFSSAANGGLSPFALINPNDIERIDILKDADATAIYGTRGANGVVLITTRKGKSGKTKVDVNLYSGQGKVGHFIPMMNLAQYRAMRKAAYANDGIVPNATNAPDLFLWDSTGAGTDWQRRYLGGTATINDIQATISGGDQRTRFLFNSGYHHETPVFPGSYKSERISTRLNVEHNSLDKKFNAVASVMYSYDNTNLLGRDLSTLYNLPPNLPLINANGSMYWNTNFTNPESYSYVNYYGKTHNLLSNLLLRYSILPGLDVKASLGYSSVNVDQNTQNPAISKSPLSGTPTNSANFNAANQRSYTIEPQITYVTDIWRGRLSALAGMTFQNSLNTSLGISGDNYSTATLLGSITGAGSFGNPSAAYTQYRYNSVFGRLTYNFDSRYLINAVFRRDGSSRFGSGKRFGNFWDIGAGWIFTNEEFGKKLGPLTFGKIRTSYGITGNDQIQDYNYTSFFAAAGTYQNSAALAPSRVENPELHWQTTNKFEVGLDLAFWNKRLELTANYYRNRTPDQLGFLKLSSQAGFNSYTANFDAVIQNKGFEFELTSRNFTSKDFTWTTSFNITIPRNKLLSAGKDYFYFNQNSLGQPLSYQLRYNYAGVDPATGRPIYKVLTKDSLTLTPNANTDRYVAGYTAPKMYGGLNNILFYKNFELSFFFQFSQQDGNILPSATPGILGSGNMTQYWVGNVWAQPGAKADLPKFTTNSANYSGYSSSDAIWGNAAYLKLRTVNLSYTLPAEVTSKLKLTHIRVYLQGQNLWWTSKNKYVYDPETGTAMPPLRIITAGLNVTF